MSNKDAIEFYTRYYYEGLKDREIIQSKITLFILSSTSFFIFAMYIVGKEKYQVIYGCYNLTKVVVWLIILFHIFILAIVYKVFVFVGYKELPLSNELESYRIENSDEEWEKILIEYYSENGAENYKINKLRREGIGQLQCIYLSGAWICLVWFILLLLNIEGYL